MLKEEVFILGIGNCGCKIAKEFLLKGYETMFINGSTQDLRYLGRDIPSNTIKKLKGFDGFGGDRNKAIDCLEKNENVITDIQNIRQEVVFVFVSGAGSTGSGLAGYIVNILLGALDNPDNEFYKNRIVVPVVCTPYTNESIAKQRNSYQLIKELIEIDQVGSIIFVDNNTNPQRDNGYAYMNNLLVESLDLFLADDNIGDKNNFDTAEKKMMMRQKGAFVLCLSKATGKDLTKDSILKSIEDGSVFAATEKDKICGNIGILHAGNDETDISHKEVADRIGQPLNSFEGFNAENTLVVLSGLSYPITLIQNIGKLAKEGQAERKNSRKALEKALEFDFEEFDLDECFEEETIRPKTVKNEDSKVNKSLQNLRERMKNRK